MIAGCPPLLHPQGRQHAAGGLMRPGPCEDAGTGGLEGGVVWPISGSEGEGMGLSSA